MTTRTARILVVGATGNVGGAVVRRLAAGGEDVMVRAMVRTPGSADLPDGVERVRGDLTDLDSVRAALRDIDRVFLVWPLGGGEPARAVVDLITAHVQRIVYLSAIGVRDDGAPAPDPILQFHTDIEQAIRASDVEWTLLRSGGMAANTLGWAQQVREQSTVSWVYGDGGRALVHEADLAEVAEIALLTDRLVGLAPEITGPSVLTQQEQASAIGNAVGRTVTWDELPAREVREALVSGGWDEATADGVLTAWASTVDRPEAPTPDFEAITGATGRTFEQWAVDHAADFR
ncbi:SDR family oxidoreductase [Promicromonospora sp. NPDC057488]|uniref:SDR family oxidoreductase n=1 Tax=Promicromonospora sp. NPDC057488 TaxID=3346147 RepID=UPI00366CDC75